MVQRIVLLLASLAAAAVLTVALAAAGFGPAPATPAASSAAAKSVEAAADVAAPLSTAEPTTQVDTVYVKPAPPRKTIRVLRPAATPPPVVIHRVAKAPGEGDGSGDGETGQDD